MKADLTLRLYLCPRARILLSHCDSLPLYYSAAAVRLREVDMASRRGPVKRDETTKLKRSTWLASRLFVWCKMSLAVRRENAQRSFN